LYLCPHLHQLINFGGTHGPLNGVLQRLLVDVMTPLLAAARVDRALAGGKSVLPASRMAGTGVFPFECKRPIDLAKALPQILLMQAADLLQKSFQWFYERLGQHCDTIFLLLALAY
jgi:hypothetical protein